MNDDTETPGKTGRPILCDQTLVDLARSRGMSPEASDALGKIDAVMHVVRRSIGRRDFSRQILSRIDPSLEVGHIDAIAAITPISIYSDQSGGEVTVGVLAERLVIDPSRASRIAADLVDRGYVRRVASQADARRICLELTEKGRTFIDAVRRNKMLLFSQALAKWREDELITFADLFARFANWATDDNGIERSVDQIKRDMVKAELPDQAAAEPVPSD